jgi:hypothetical protein
VGSRAEQGAGQGEGQGRASGPDTGMVGSALWALPSAPTAGMLMNYRGLFTE